MFSLSQILGDVSAAHHQAPDDWARSVTTVVRDAAIYHTARNGFYRAQCDAVGVDPATLHALEDLQRLPLLPVGLFKRADARVLLTCSLSKVETEARSTGTSGVSSVVRRDAETVTRALVGLIGRIAKVLIIFVIGLIGYTILRHAPRMCCRTLTDASISSSTPTHCSRISSTRVACRGL